MNYLGRFLLVLFFWGGMFSFTGNIPLLFAQDDPAATVSQDPSSTELTLPECYQLALKQSEKIAIQQQLIKETEARFLQSLSGILPRVSYSLSEKRQDGRGDSNFTLREIPEQKFVFSQPLFSGFKEFAAMAASRAEGRQRKQEKIRAEQLLFTDVADAFYFFFTYQQDLETLEAIHTALAQRVEELKSREELGRARPSEVASAESRLSRIEAELELVKARQATARQLMEFLIGKPFAALLDPVAERPALEILDTYLAKVDQRPDVMAFKEAWEVAKKEVVVARAGFFPVVGMDGNYYTKRTGNSSDVDWDVTLKVDVPLFQGGENVGKTKEASAKEQGAKLKFAEARRNAVLDIQNIYTQYAAALKRTAALAKALQAVEKNYELQKEDYRFNLVNNLEVLQALEELQDVRREHSGVTNETKQLYWKLQAATGEISYDAF
ncbi:MAG: hypothetical protein A3D10_04015 [Omnitrophica WOR_2 bacterium RIFCSPHIGHO2_02_FULL_48_11]|nr:MAG: hypothetical protein A3D10_04015 [Omnitrophica WOR_2 bacterium RIFCSPHIGHO2_02_FULL_48_11]